MTPEEHLQKYSFKHADRLNKIAAPLADLGVDVMTYERFSDDGKFSILTNEYDATGYFYDQELFINNPTFCAPKVRNSGVFFPDMDPMVFEMQSQVTEKFGIGQIIYFGERVGGEYYGFAFAAHDSGESVFSRFLKRIPLFKAFIRHFMIEARPLITECHENSFDLGAIMGDFYYASPEQQFSSDADEEFLSKLITSPELSNREHECIYWLCRGNTAKQIGEKLDLSRRTVEFYLENVKNKWDCWTKEDLIERAFFEMGMSFAFGSQVS